MSPDIMSEAFGFYFYILTRLIGHWVDERKINYKIQKQAHPFSFNQTKIENSTIIKSPSP